MQRSHWTLLPHFDFSDAMSPAFALSGLVLAAAIVTRFPPVAALLPALVLKSVPVVVGATLGLLGALERRTKRGEVGPLWMQLGRPLSLGLALGLSYFTTVFAQELGVSLGPVDPTFPASAGSATGTVWFFAFTLGFVGVGMMSAPALLVPLLRVVTAPFARTSLTTSVLGSMGLAAAFAFFLLVGARTPQALELVEAGQAFFDSHAAAGSLVLIALGVVPNLFPSKGD